jgi:hypothetical protein
MLLLGWPVTPFLGNFEDFLADVEATNLFLSVGKDRAKSSQHLVVLVSDGNGRSSCSNLFSELINSLGEAVKTFPALVIDQTKGQDRRGVDIRHGSDHKEWEALDIGIVGVPEGQTARESFPHRFCGFYGKDNTGKLLAVVVSPFGDVFDVFQLKSPDQGTVGRTAAYHLVRIAYLTFSIPSMVQFESG